MHTRDVCVFDNPSNPPLPVNPAGTIEGEHEADRFSLHACIERYWAYISAFSLEICCVQQGECEEPIHRKGQPGMREVRAFADFELELQIVISQSLSDSPAASFFWCRVGFSLNSIGLLDIHTRTRLFLPACLLFFSAGMRLSDTVTEPSLLLLLVQHRYKVSPGNDTH